MNAPTSADATQVAGTHYKRLPIQPWNFIAANEQQVGFFEGNVIAYICRWRTKGGVEDLRKVRHYVDKMIELAVTFGWPHAPMSEAQIAALLGPAADESKASEDLALRGFGCIPDGHYRRVERSNVTPCAETTRVPVTDDAAVEQAVDATRLVTEALKTCTAIHQGVIVKPFPVQTALRTTIKHTESSLLTALRDLQAFRDIVRENNAHE